MDILTTPGHSMELPGRSGNTYLASPAGGRADSLRCFDPPKGRALRRIQRDKVSGRYLDLERQDFAMESGPARAFAPACHESDGVRGSEWERRCAWRIRWTFLSILDVAMDGLRLEWIVSRHAAVCSLVSCGWGEWCDRSLALNLSYRNFGLFGGSGGLTICKKSRKIFVER